jgi:hypothetical protein
MVTVGKSVEIQELADFFATGGRRRMVASALLDEISAEE